MQEKNSVLFISHDASRTGAPILLLDFIDWFKENAQMEFRIVLRERGDLESEFNKRGETYVFKDHLNDPYSLVHLLKDTRVVYSNTVTNGNLLELFSQLRCPIITHVHEMDFVIRFFGYDNFNKVKRYTTHWIATSELVRENLTERYDITEKDITLVKEFIPSSLFKELDQSKIKARSDILRELNIEEDAAVIFACGTIEWRKGPDLFIQVANVVLKRIQQDNVHFVWIGDAFDKTILNQLIYEVELLQISKNVHFCGFKENLRDYLLAGELFLLTSREDPFPVVALLASSAEKPIICFDKATGIVEFAEDDAALIVPFMDVQRMAEKVIYLLKEKELCKRLGANALDKVRREYTVEKVGPRILDVINGMLKKYPMDENRSELLVKLQDTEEELHSTRQQLHVLEQELNVTRQQLNIVQQQVSDILKCETFVIGKLVAWFPIKVKSFLKKCWQYLERFSHGS